MDCKNRNFLHRLSVSVLALVLTLLLVAPPASASNLNSYYDWGSYYYKEQVLGVTFSSLENLPAPAIPKDAVPLPAQGILPGSPLYNFEILTENVQLALTFNPVQRETQRLAFATERLSEIKTLVDRGDNDLANNAASIYKNTMDAVSQNTQALHLQNAPGVSDLVAKVEDTAASHEVAAQSLALSSPPSVTSSWAKVIDATEKAMDTTADVLKKPAIPEDLSTSIQALKEQGLITPEESDKLYSFSSRSQVREELDKLVTSGQFPGAEVIKLDQAVATKYPQTYGETQEVLKFAELRIYQTLTPPTTEIVNEITRWQSQSGDTPPPGEIRPYLYYNRAQELAKDIDFSRFEPEQQSEVARFYPESVVQNPTFSGTPPIPSPSPSPASPPASPNRGELGGPSPSPTSETDEAPAPSPSPSPSPTPPPIGPYLTDYKGPLPGTFGYFFKNIGEQASLATTFNPASRMELEMRYTDERLSEARALSQENGKEKQYVETLARYQSYIEAVSDNVKSFRGSDEDKRDLARALESESARHNVVFEKGLLPPPSGDTKVYTAAINATEDAMDKTSDVLGRPALPPTLANRLQDMKAQGIILEEEVSDLTNANSREEVREKIRTLTKLGTFPPADAKKLDEAQSLVAPSDFNQLTEVRKIEELQSLRAVQAEFAQTATLRQTGAGYEQRVKSLLDTIDPSLIRAEDLAGREDLIKTYREIAAKAPTKPVETPAQTAELLTPKPYFVAPDSPFYFLKRAAEAVQVATAIAPQAREEIKLAQAKERFAEAYALLEKNNEEGFKDSLTKYTGAMQSVYNDLDKGLSLSSEAKKELGEELAKEVTEQNLLLQKVSIFASKEAATPISAATSVITQGVDRASDLQGEPPIPQNIKEKLDALPKDMLSDEQKKKLADANTRLEARLVTSELAATGALTQADLAVLDNWMTPEDSGSVLRLNEIKKLSEAVELTSLKEDIAEKVKKTEDIAEKVDEFKKSFKVGQEVPADVRPYVRLTRIDEISKTIRPDAVRLEDFGNRKDIQLAVATLQQEFRPTREDFRRLEDFRRGSPGRSLPPELARIEALSFSIGVRDTAQACFLPSPPFAANTPCPPTGASIPISSYYNGGSSFPGIGGFGAGNTSVTGYGTPGALSVDKDGKPLVYGKGPEASKPGVCQDGYHWMYDSGGWCMSNSGNYSSNNTPSYSQGPYSSGPGYTPYTPYYSAPGAPNYGGPSYGGGGYYTGPNYYGPAPTTYTTNPPPGTVPGSGPQPTSPGQCPSDYHWMPPGAGQAGWCMSNGGNYVGGGYGGGGGVNPPQPCPAGAYWSSYSNSCVSGDTRYPGTPYPGGGGSCPSGQYWTGGPSGGSCVTSDTWGVSWPSPNLTQSSCGPGYYWSGNACYPNPSYPGYGTGSSCSPPAGGCGSGWFDSGSCSCKQASSQGCYNVSASSCGSGFYWDSGACTCRSTGTTSTSGGSGGTSSGSCPSGYHWMSDSGGWCMSDSTSGGSTGTTSTSGGGTTSGSCPSGSHWMSDNGGWCMSDGGSGGGSTPTTTTTQPTTTTTEPQPTSAPTESTQPAPTSPPSEPAPTATP